MIKFFRQIRFDLMEKNKTTNYLKYAFGEIILVVVGILIALQINNLNENRKTNEIRQTYYHQIIEDLHKEKVYAQDLIDELNESISSYETFNEYENNPDLKPIEIIKALTKVEFTFAIFNFRTPSVDALESTGDIRLMPEAIRDKLIDIKSDQEFLIRQQNINDQHYVAGQQKAYQLGFWRLAFAPENFQDINVNDNISEIILILKSSNALKNFTEKDKIRAIKNYLKSLNELEELLDEEIIK